MAPAHHGHGSGLLLENQEEVIAEIYSQVAPPRSLPPRLSEQPRVLHLPVGGANQPAAFADAMRGQKVLADCLLNGVNKYQFPCDLSFENFLSEKQEQGDLAAFQEIAERYDVFHYHARPLYFSRRLRGYPSGLDMILLRTKGKKTFFPFPRHGD